MCERYPPEAPPKLYHCMLCSDEVQELKTCQCGADVCPDCTRICWVCETKQCKWCITKKDCNEEYICEICLSNREYLISEWLGGVSVLDYYHSATEETDEEIILEFSSIDYPKVKVCIAKVKE